MTIPPCLSRFGSAAASEPRPTGSGQAARDFEALMISELLKSMPEGWLGTGDDHAGAYAVDLAEQQFAGALAASGGLGLAALIKKIIEAPASADKKHYER